MNVEHYIEIMQRTEQLSADTVSKDIILGVKKSHLLELIYSTVYNFSKADRYSQRVTHKPSRTETGSRDSAVGLL